MSRLLNANFARLFKSKLFYICAGTAFVFALIEAIKCALELTSSSPHPEESLFNSSGTLLLFCETVLVGIFVGAEHGGALRNKIISGKSRTEIFLANAITCSAAAAMLQFVYMAAALLTGLICGEKFILSFGEIALCELLQLASLIEMCVIVSAISLIDQQKFDGTIWSILIIILLFIFNSFISGRISSLKYSHTGLFNNTPMVHVERTDITEDKLMQISILESVQDMTLFGQQAQIKDSFYNAFYYEAVPQVCELPVIFDGEKYQYQKIPIPVEILPYSLGMIILTTAVGTLVFRKKDIK